MSFNFDFITIIIINYLHVGDQCRHEYYIVKV